MPTGPTAAIPTAPTARTPTAPTATARTEPTPPEPHFPALAELIGAEAVPGFLAAHLGADAYRTELAPQRARALFGWPQLNAALAEHRLAPPRLRLERAGADATKGVFKARRTRRGDQLYDLDSGVLNARLREGATLILDSANELSAPLQKLCEGLAAEFACSCQANLYACWGTTQGFDVHWDDHDVFVVQVDGAKRWALYGSTRVAPTRRDEHAEHAKPETPIDEILLQAGDVLYLPRGYWHAAVGLGEPTLHLTIGLTRKTGGDFLHWLADQSLADAAVRTDLPLERDDAVLGAHLAGVLASLAAHDPATLARQYRRHVEASQAHRPALSFPSIGAETAFAPQTPLALAAGVARVRREPDAVVLSWRGSDYRVAPSMEPALAAMVQGQSLTFEAMQRGLDERTLGLLPGFVAEMIGRGVFTIGGRG